MGVALQVASGFADGELIWMSLGRTRGPLRRAEVLPSMRYEALRPGLRPHLLTLKRARRVVLTPWATLAFECRRTVWSQAHEELRFFPDPQPHHVDEVLARANVLVPHGDLRATLFFHGEAQTIVPRVRRASSHIGELTLHLAGRTWRAVALDPYDSRGCLPSAAFLQFALAGPSNQQPGLAWPTFDLHLALRQPTVRSLIELIASPEATHHPSTREPIHVRP